MIKQYYGLKGKMMEMGRISATHNETMITSGRNKIIAVKKLSQDGAVEIVKEFIVNGKTVLIEYKLKQGVS